MRVAGGILGIIGGVLGLFLAAFLLFVGGVSKVAATAAANDPSVNSNITAAQKADLDKSIQQVSDFGNIAGGLGLVLVALCVLGIIGGIFGFFKPPLGALMMVIAAIGGFFIANVFWGVSGIFLLLGAILAFIGTFQKQNQPQTVGATLGYSAPAPGGYPPPGYYPQQQAYPPQPGYYPQQQAYPQQPGFPPAPNQYGQPGAPQQNYYPQPTGQNYPPPQTGPQSYYPQPTVAPQGQQSVPPKDDTRLN